MAERVYNFSDLLTTGATKSNLTHWIREQVIVPVFPQSPGTGHHKKFGFRNMLEALIALYLNGIPIAHMRTILDLFRFVDDVATADAAGNQKRLAALVKHAPKFLTGEPHADGMLAYLVRRWRMVKTPETRSNMYFALAYSLHDRSVSVITVASNEEFIPEQHIAGAAVIVDVRALLTALEDKTQDRLDGPLTPDQIDAALQRTARK
jgi:hypothetical protein